MAEGERSARSVLIIDDAEAVRAEVRRVLTEHELFGTILEAESGISAFKLLKAQPVDLILCDVIMPNVDGFKFLTMIRDRPEFAELPVIMLTGQEDLRAKVRGFGAGASDYLTKPFHEEELVARVRVHLKIKELQDALRKKNLELEELSATDPLTKLRNRRYLDEVFAHEFLRARRYGTPLSFILVDLDHFMSINDEHGHLVGDRALEWAARLLKQGMREHDLIARYGGEEFGVLLPHTGIDGACTLAERFRKRLESSPLAVGKGALRLTASFGVAGMPDAGIARPQDMIRRADEALLRAKEAGRNRVLRWKAE